MFLYRKARLDDIKYISELFYLLSIEDGLKPDKNEFLKKNSNYLESIINDSNFLILVAELNKDIVGVSLSKILSSRNGLIYERRGEISRIFVKKDNRGKGIASNLIKKNKAFFKRAKIKKIRVFVFKKNKGAQSFWRHINFKELMDVLEFSL